jgi:hypothetical protein
VVLAALGDQVPWQLHARIHDQPARQFISLKSRLATNIAGIGLLDEPLKIDGGMTGGAVRRWT